MGWNGGTEIFDTVVKDLFEGSTKEETIINLLGVLENLDWDNMCESFYYTHPTMKRILASHQPPLWNDDE